MTIKKWVEFEKEVDVEIDGREVALAFREAWDNASDTNEKPSRWDILAALNKVAMFLHALSDEQIADLTDKQREAVHNFLETEAARWRVKP